MTTKIKLFYIFLALIAVVSVFSFFDVFTGVRALRLNPITELEALPNDTDSDGLDDSDESYWNTDFQNPDSDGDGFLDGEEVLSRHDPTVAGPNDSLADINITQKVAGLTIGGLLEGSLKTSNPEFESQVDDLTLSVVDDSLASFVAEVDLSKVRGIESNKESQEMYIQNIASIWEKFVKALYQEIEEIGPTVELTNKGGMSNSDFIQYFITQRELFNSIANEAIQLPVPAKWLEKHADFITYISQYAEINNSLAQGKDDPIRATIGFNLFVNLTDSFPSVIESFFEDLSLN